MLMEIDCARRQITDYELFAKKRHASIYVILGRFDRLKQPQHDDGVELAAIRLGRQNADVLPRLYGDAFS